MEIERINVGPWGKTLAYMDVKTSEGLILKGFKLIDGAKGMFVGVPSRKGNDDKYYDDVYLTQDLRSELTKLAIAAYESNGGKAPASTPQEADASQDDDPFADEDDIPF